jgi:phosphoribosylglycinamide formyltransferase-1
MRIRRRAAFATHLDALIGRRDVSDHPTPVRRRIAVLVSGSGSNLQALLDAIDADPHFGGQVVVVGCDRDDAYGTVRAEAAGIPVVVQRLGDHPDRPTWERALRDGLLAHAPEIVVLAGFMRVLSAEFVATWPRRVINTHPSLLPAFRGAHAVRDALAFGVKVTGSTVHLVDDQVDHGPIVAQRPVDVLPDDTEKSLHDRIKAVEHELFPACVRHLCQDRLDLHERVVTIRPASRPPSSTAPSTAPSTPPTTPQE